RRPTPARPAAGRRAGTGDRARRGPRDAPPPPIDDRGGGREAHGPPPTGPRPRSRVVSRHASAGLEAPAPTDVRRGRRGDRPADPRPDRPGPDRRPPERPRSPAEGAGGPGSGGRRRTLAVTPTERRVCSAA